MTNALQAASKRSKSWFAPLGVRRSSQISKSSIFLTIAVNFEVSKSKQPPDIRQEAVKSLIYHIITTERTTRSCFVERMNRSDVAGAVVYPCRNTINISLPISLTASVQKSTLAKLHIIWDFCASIPVLVARRHKLQRCIAGT